MNDLMNIVSSQIQKAISEAFNEQVLPQIQATLRSGQGQGLSEGWNVPVERQDNRSEGAFNRKFRSSSRGEFPQNLMRKEVEEERYDEYSFEKF